MMRMSNISRRRKLGQVLLWWLLLSILGIFEVGADGTPKPAETAKGEAKTETNDQQQQPSGPQQTCEEAPDGTCKIRIVTEEELATKNGEDGGKELWLSIFGQVYNVSKGPQYYAPGSGYHVFAGRDGTVPFITGNFTAEEAAKHTDELTAAQLYAVDREWSQFYAKEEKYPFVGYLCCRFYDEEGKPTEETLRVWERVKGYEKIKAAKDKERKENRRKKMLMNMGGAMMAGKMITTTTATKTTPKTTTAQTTTKK